MIKKLEYKPLPVEGFKAAGIHSGIKAKPDMLDLALIYCENAAAGAGVFTQNITKAAPVSITEEHLSQAVPKAILINSGNANACTGTQGMADAIASAKVTAETLGIEANEVLIASTGIIGVPMPMDVVLSGIQSISSKLSEDGIGKASTAIMTTDTFEKAVSIEVELGGKKGRITGISKGSGMIHPNMATMLGFVMTDMAVDDAYLKALLKKVAAKSFNMISVDGDTSTNDMVLALSSASENAPSIESDADKAVFDEAFSTVCIELAKLIAKDGEGATKLLECCVSSASTETDAALAAKSVISSSLVKSAFFGSDANWGRIICAMGYSGSSFTPEKVDLKMVSKNGEIELMKAGAPVPFDEDHALKVLSADTIQILAELNEGDCSATAWGCDLTYEYVKINGEYRS